MSWSEELHLTPTHNRELLQKLIGRRVISLSRGMEESPEVTLDSVPYSGPGMTPGRLFSLADGPVLIELEGMEDRICLASSEELLSVIIWQADERAIDNDWPFRMGTDDPVYSEPRFATYAGARINGVRVFTRVVDPDKLEEPTSTGMHVMSHKVLARPREALLTLSFDDGHQLAFAAWVDAPSNFAIYTDEDLQTLPPGRYSETLHLTAGKTGS